MAAGSGGVKYSWSVAMRRYSRRGEHMDTTEYGAVIATSIDDACHRALKQAREDSGVKSGWKVTSAIRGDWVVA